jgi:hypothetical protein
MPFTRHQGPQIRFKWVGHVANTGNMIKCIQVLVQKQEEKRLFGGQGIDKCKVTPMHNMKANNEMEI